MIIRKFEHSDTEEIVEIWYKASVIAHSFIPKEMWELHKEELRNKYLPVARNYLNFERNEICGRAIIQDNLLL